MIDPKLLLPRESTETVDGRLAVSSTVSDAYMQFSRFDIIQRVWDTLYHEMALKVAKATSGKKGYYLTRYEPKVRLLDDWNYIFELYGEIMQAPTREVVIPAFRYDPVHPTMPVEWRCGHCSMPNPMEARYCGEKHKHAAGCGAPRALLIQEM